MVTILIILCVSVVMVSGNPLAQGMHTPICPALIQDENMYRNLMNFPTGSLRPTNIPYHVPENVERHRKTLEPHNIIANDELHQKLLSKILENPVIRSIVDPFSNINGENGNGGPNIVNNYIIVPSDYLKLNATREQSRRAKVNEGITNRFNRKQFKARKNNGFSVNEPTCLPDDFFDVLDIDPGLRPKYQRESPMQTKLKINTHPVCNLCGPFDFVEENERRSEKREQDNELKNAKRNNQNNSSVRTSRRHQCKPKSRERNQSQQCTVPGRNVNDDSHKSKQRNESNRKTLPCNHLSNPRHCQNEMRSTNGDTTRIQLITENNTPERCKPLNTGKPYLLNNVVEITDNPLVSKQTEDAVLRNFLKMYPNVPEIVARNLMSYMRHHWLRHPNFNLLFTNLPTYPQTNEDPYFSKDRRTLNRNNVMYKERPGTRCNDRRPKTKIRIDSSKSNVPVVELYPGFLEIGPVNIGKVDPIKEHAAVVNPLLLDSKQGINMQQMVSPETENVYINDDVLPPYLAACSENLDVPLGQEDAVPVVYENYIIEDYYPHFIGDNFSLEDDDDSGYENGQHYPSFETDKDFGRYERHDSKHSPIMESFYNDESVISKHQKLHDDYRIPNLDANDFRTTKVSNLVTNDLHPVYDDPGKNEAQGALKSNQYKNNKVETVYANSKVVVYPQDSPEGFKLMS